MKPKPARAPIRQLPESLANQIAAGEVIERPASVVKELVENSLDAQADDILIEVDRGGMQRIEVTDNGTGMTRAELPLAVAAHATSKLDGPEALMRIASLGFRGEALASICAVSRWCLSSCEQGSDEGWQVCLEHEQPRPTAHPGGTRVRASSLFYNVPARRKFLRTEQTEYRHIETVFRRLALSEFAVGFTLKHNGRVTQKLSIAGDSRARARRIGKLCGKRFLDNARWLDTEWQGMKLYGWLGRADYSRSQGDVQYFYINGRIIRDRIINHAIRQAYQSELYPGRFAAYVLYLELPFDEVDVNVHPTKHEVRLRQARQVHDFLSRALREVLYPDPQTRLWSAIPVHQERYHAPATGPSTAAMLGEATQAYPAATVTEPSRSAVSSTAEACAAVLFNRFALFREDARYWLLDVYAVQRRVVRQRLGEAFQGEPLKSKPLLIPLTLNLDTAEISKLIEHSDALQHFGIEFSQAGPTAVMIRAVPAVLSGYIDPGKLMRTLGAQLKKGGQQAELTELVAEHSAECAASLDCEAVERLVQELRNRGLAITDMARELESADLRRLVDRGGD